MKDRIYHSEEELLEHAKSLLNKSLYDLYGDESIQGHDTRDKGKLGQLVERLHYGINNNNESRPDVENLGIEIKVSPLKLIYKGTDVSPDQRTTLCMINYDALLEESFESSHFFKKNNKILLNLYLRGTERMHDSRFLLIDMLQPSGNDLKIIRDDWDLIRAKVRAGEADSLSQSDTNYLCAATKGSGKQKAKPYMGGTASAKKRSFSFKQAYIKHILKQYKLTKNENEEYYLARKKYSGISLLSEQEVRSLEDAVLEKFDPYLGMSDKDIATAFKHGYMFSDEEKKDKSRWHYITSLILTGKKKKFLSNHIEEFSKSGLTVKTVRIDKNHKVLQEVSFRTQSYETIMTSEWENSSCYNEIANKFLWVVFQEDGQNDFKLLRCFFWAMPPSDVDFVRRKWTKLKELVGVGNFKHQYFQDDDSFYYLKIKDSKGGANKEHGDQLVTRLAHWFRKDYVANLITHGNKG